LQAQRLQAIALMHQRQYQRAERKLVAALFAAQLHMRASRSTDLLSQSCTSLPSSAVSLADGASTGASSTILEADEEVKQILFDLMLRLAAACHVQGKLKEAVRRPPGPTLQCTVGRSLNQQVSGCGTSNWYLSCSFQGKIF
jgi:hypothetical protein